MKHTVKLVIASIVTLCLATAGPPWVTPHVSTQSQQSRQPLWGDVQSVQAAYEQWRESYHWRGGERNFVVSLGWAKGLSAEFTRAGGQAALDLVGGSIAVEVYGLPHHTAWDVWLVDNQPGPGRTVQPEAGDVLLRVGGLTEDRDRRRLQADLGVNPLQILEIDLVVVAPAGEDPSESGILFGIPTLFQRLYLRELRGYARPDSSLSILEGNRSAPALLSVFGAHVAQASEPELAQLVPIGEDLFFNETFDGNSRTCGTCHRAENNLTIDPQFIATLPATDPLFVAEFVPALAKNFENPLLMRALGLILENVDGFDDLEHKFVMRGVPHTLALTNALTPAPNGVDGTTIPPNQRTGWSGDGAPGSGTLREFAIGAVVQHFTQTLGRIAGEDFRLPTDEELDALEAFQLSLGRQQDLDLSTLVLHDRQASRGQEIFQAADTEGGTVAAGKCGVCHANAGANVAAGFNFNFDTGVEQLPDQPADRLDPNNPPDGGFGSEPNPADPRAFGNGTFNTPTLVEAADTGPFFHNNSVDTLEGAVDFYNSAAFNNSPSGRFLASRDSAGIGIQLAEDEVAAVAAFLRVINALENIRMSTELTRPLVGNPDAGEVRGKLLLSIAELEDAIQVLQKRRLHPDAVRQLQLTILFEEIATALTEPLSDSELRQLQASATLSIMEHEGAIGASGDGLPSTLEPQLATGDGSHADLRDVLIRLALQQKKSARDLMRVAPGAPLAVDNSP